jgi:class 3 adenylate cyclase/tetratricopeptide (TPR) repeat protein
MKFSEVIEQASTLLQQKGRITYRSLKREFDLDEDALEDLKFELIDGQRVAMDEDGKVLVWVGAAPVLSTEFRVPSPPQSPTPNTQHLTVVSSQLSVVSSQPPSAYTPLHLAERIRAEQAALEARGSADGERKTITALFADLKGSTALIEGLDPEEARAIIDPALQLMMDAVHQYDGYVAQALGDGIFALFGAPLAHEDHPQRALYAALRMQESMHRYADTLRAKGYPPLLMRVGINTGEVVLRSIRKDDLHADYVPVGHSTNLAARMEQLATPGSIVVSAYTHRLTDGYFAFKDLGATQIKGVEEPLHIYEVLGVGPLRTRLQVSVRRGLTRFVGRQSELEQLQQALEQAKAGHGQIVGTMGEPGLGKSRLFYEFVGAYGRTPLLVLEAYSVSHGKATAYLPVIELLKSYFDIQTQDDERKRREKVGGKVLMLDRSLEDTLPYLFALLGIEEQPSPLQQMDAQIRRQRTFEALKKLFLRESLNQPLVLIFEDLHWIDGETQGFLDVLSESVASARLLLLTNYRPEYRHEWGGKTYYTQLRLAPFGKAEAEEFLTALLGESVGATGRSPLHALKQLILEKTQGTPFFMEEIVQELIEQEVLVRDAVGAHSCAPLPTELHIPPTVQGILVARIDRLAPDEKALLQQLAVIGRQFPMSLIRQVLTQSEADLYRLLASLQRKEFLYEQPAFPESEYIFKHALTQEVAYGTVLQEQRKALHEQTAQAIEALFHDRLEEHYDELARHYSRGGNTEKAIEYLELAGKQAVQQSANAEAIAHLTAALDLLSTLPASAERAKQELTLLLTLGSPLRVVKGYTAPEVETTYMRARALSQQIGDPRLRFAALRGLWGTYTARGEGDKTQAFGDEILGFMRTTQESALLIEGHHTLVMTRISGGEFAQAYAHSQQGCALYNPREHHSLVFLYAQDPRIGCMVYGAWSQWFLGYPEQAWRRMREALTLQQQLAHPFSQANFLNVALALHQFSREMGSAPERAEALVTLATEHGFPMALGAGLFWRGWVLTQQGAIVEGVEIMKQAFDSLQGAGYLRMWVSPVLAAAYGEAGQYATGLALLTEALTVADRTRIRIVEAELHRLKGELTLQQQWKVKSQKVKVSNTQHPTPDTQAEAKGCFLRAIEIAQRQQAKSLELRAVMSLVRLWQRQGKHAEARQMLAKIYNWFTEGFDTKDLTEAKALLEELQR